MERRKRITRVTIWYENEVKGRTEMKMVPHITVLVFTWNHALLQIIFSPSSSNFVITFEVVEDDLLHLATSNEM